MSLAILLVFLLIAAYTDLRSGKVYNKTTYTGMLVALLLSIAGSILLVADNDPGVWDVMFQAGTFRDTSYGLIPLPAALVGWLTCGVMMIVCYVFFPGEVGGGDVKLIAMMGAFLGVMSGFEAMLWTFIVAACVSIILLIFQVGAWELFKRGGRYALFFLRFAARPAVSEEDRKALKRLLYLAPCAVAGVLLARFDVFAWIGW